MSYALGAENDTILDLFSYYHQLKDWKLKLKSRIKSTVFRRSVSCSDSIIVGSPHPKRNNNITKGVVINDKKPRCVSMVELGGGKYRADPQFIVTSPPPAAAAAQKRTGKGLKRSKSLKEKITDRADAVYRKFGANSSANKDGDESKRPMSRKDLNYSLSSGNVNGEFSARTDLLKRFGQQSIHLKHDKDLAKTVFELFEKEKGPDVKPPRNERRTLKLHKTEKEGFGFWLQTYGFTKNGSGVQKRTFVRYVEDEGPAYMAGLREGDVIVEVNEKHVQDIEHAKIVEIIKEARSELKLVVKFIDAVRRVELAVRLKKRQAKLKSTNEELEKLKRDEYNLLNGLQQSSLDDTSSESSASLQENEEKSLHTSTESEISSISSVSDEVIVRTSKFGKRSSHVLDSIKELNCNESTYTVTSDTNCVATTTEDELLNFYCDRSDYTTSLPRTNRYGCSLKRVESMPVQKYRSLPRKKGMIYLDGSYAREYAIDYSTTGHISNADSYLSNDSFDYTPSDDSSDEGSSRNSYNEQSIQEKGRTPRRSNRPKSYKMAVRSTKTQLEEHGEINQV